MKMRRAVSLLLTCKRKEGVLLFLFSLPSSPLSLLHSSSSCFLPPAPLLFLSFRSLCSRSHTSDEDLNEAAENRNVFTEIQRRYARLFPKLNDDERGVITGDVSPSKEKRRRKRS